MNKGWFSSRNSSWKKRNLARLFVAAGLMLLLAVTTMVANASQASDQASVVDPCAVFPPPFPTDLTPPDSFLTLLELQKVENDTTAQAYYKAVDPFDRRTTLNDWLVVTGFIQNPGDIQPGPGGDALVQTDAFAMYVNGVDLGVTRRFYSRTLPNGNVVSYTENYPCLRDAKLRQNLLATVGMEYAPPDDGSSTKKFVSFYAYGPNNERILSINLDGRGAKAIPGVCIVCHGGRPADLVGGIYPNHGNVGASFLPWDVTAFIFDTEDPSLSRAALEAGIKNLNKAALATYDKRVKWDEVAKIYRPNAMVELVQGWYGGPTLPSPTFIDSFTPAGWKGANVPAEAEALYHEVIATSCRSCHVSRARSLDFATFKGFMVFEAATRRLTFQALNESTPYGSRDDRGIMPLALQTFNNFWATSRPDQLKTFLNNH